MAFGFGKNCIPHFSSGIISLAANLHLGASLNNVNWFELTMDENPLRNELGYNLPIVSNGLIFLNGEPGLGIKLNEEVLSESIGNHNILRNY